MKRTDKPLSDATEPIEFTIKRSDIDKAISRDPENCVVARGVKRVLNGTVEGVEIGATIGRVDFGGTIGVKRYNISKETRDMIKAYDAANFYAAGVPVKLLPPSPSTRLGVHTAGRPTKNPGSRGSDIKRPFLRHIDQAH